MATEEAATTEETTVVEETTTTESEQPPKSADEYRQELRRYERTAKRSNAEKDKRIQELEASLEQHAEATKSEQEKLLDQARKEAADQARAETTNQFRSKIVRSEIRAHAAGLYQDPDDAVRLLDLEDADIFDDEGDVKTDALKEALNELLERKPHLGATAGNGHKPQGDADAGKGGPGKGVEDLSVDEHLSRVQRK